MKFYTKRINNTLQLSTYYTRKFTYKLCERSAKHSAAQFKAVHTIDIKLEKLK